MEAVRHINNGGREDSRRTDTVSVQTGKKERKKAAIINLIFLTITITTFVSPNRAHTIDFKASDSLFEEQAIVFVFVFL